MKQPLIIITAGLLCCVRPLCAETPAPIIHKEINLSPANPIENWTIELPPKASAKLTVNVDLGSATSKYKIKSGPDPSIASSAGNTVIWRKISGEPGESTFVFDIMNTATAVNASTTAKVECVWEAKKGTGTGGRGVTTAPDIDGLATAMAQLPLTGSCAWSFDRTTQVADGKSVITYKATHVNGQGQPLITQFTKIESVNLAPATATWSISPDTGPSSLVGTVTSIFGSEGRLQATYTEGGAIISSPALTVLKFVPVDIVPDDYMAGVVGDVVKSAKAGSTIKHFVTPKAAATVFGPPEPINQPYVVLKATGITAAQITLGNPAQIFEWSGGESFDPRNPLTEPLKRKVKRDATGMTEVKIKAKQGGAVVKQMDVWVIWAEVKQEQGDTKFVKVPNPDGYAAWQVIPEEGKQKRFVFSIKPKSITDLNADIPDLMGVVSSQHLPPGSGKHFYGDKQYDPESVIPIALKTGDHAQYKWDVSRQVQITMINTDLISKNDLKTVWWPSVCVGQPDKDPVMPVKFPTLDFEGNDDPLLSLGVSDEDDDPYHVASIIVDQRHAVGELTSTDSPNAPALDNWVTNYGMKFEFRFEFREFARVQLWDGSRTNGQFWFRISNLSDGEWHHHAKFKSQANFWENNGSMP